MSEYDEETAAVMEWLAELSTVRGVTSKTVAIRVTTLRSKIGNAYKQTAEALRRSGPRHGCGMCGLPMAGPNPYCVDCYRQMTNEMAAKSTNQPRETSEDRERYYRELLDVDAIGGLTDVQVQSLRDQIMADELLDALPTAELVGQCVQILDAIERGE